MRDKLFALSVLLTAAVLFFADTGRTQEPPKCVGDAAAMGLPYFLSLFPSRMLGEGLAADEVLQRATLDEPYLLHTITPNALSEFSSGMHVGQLLSKTTLWYFPVTVEGSPVAILVVEYDPGNRCEAVALGYTKLADRLANSQSGPAWRAGKKPVLGAVFQAKEYFLADSEGQPDRFFSLKYPSPEQAVSAAQEEEDLVSAVERLRPVVVNNLKEGKR